MSDEKEEVPKEVQDAVAEMKAFMEQVEAEGGRRFAAMSLIHMLIEAAGDAKPFDADQLSKMSPEDRGRFQNMLRMGQATKRADLDRLPTKERNGREVVTDALDQQTLYLGPVKVLIGRFLDLAVAMHWAYDNGRITRYNRLQKRIHAIGEALKARTPDGRAELLPYLKDRNPGIRRFAASYCREIAPEEARAALETLTYDTAGAFGASAAISLDMPKLTAEWEASKRQPEAEA